MARKAKESVPAEEIVPAEEPVNQEMAVVPVKEPEPEPIPVPAAKGPSFGQRVGRFFRFLFRLVLTLLILGAIAAGVYFGWPLVYRQYILPVQENTNQLVDLRNQQSQSEQTIAELQSSLSALQTEQAQQAQSLTELGDRVGQIETDIAARTESLAVLEAMLVTLQSQNEAHSAELERQIKLLKSMELLSRARLFMYQSNFGLARQDVQSARDLLATVQPDAPEPLAEDLSAVILRLDLTLSNLPNFPVAASDDLDIAWQILISGVPEAQTSINETPALEVASTPTPLVTSTPAPQEAATPTPTP